MATLEEQIKQRWGQYGDWQSAGHDQVTALANLFRANGIDDISSLKFQQQKTTRPGYRQETENGSEDVAAFDFNTYDAVLGDKKIDFLGDINRDGSTTTSRRAGNQPGNDINAGSLGGDILAWSSQGRGNTSFKIMPGPDGEAVVVPVWGSSRSNTYDDIRGIATVAAIAAGGAMAAGSSAGGAAAGAASTAGGAAATGTWEAVLASAGKAAATNAGLTLARGGSLGDAVKAGAIGAVTGGAGGALSSLGVNPIVAGAATGALGSAVRGGDGKDILMGAASGGVSGVGNGITGNSVIDRAITDAGKTAIRGGSGRDILTSAVTGAGGAFVDDSINDIGGDATNNVADSGDSGSDDMFMGDEDFDLGELDWGDFDFGGIDTSSATDMTGGFYTSPRADEDYGNEGRNYTTQEPESDYSNEGRNYQTTASTQGDGGSPVNASTNAPDGPGIINRVVSGAGKFITDNKLGPSLLNLGAGMINSYMAQKNAKEMTEEQRRRYAEGYKSGAGLSLFNKNPTYKTKGA